MPRPLAGLVVLIAACDPDGGVALHFERPDNPALDPLTDDVRELTLRATAAGTPMFQAAAAYDGDAVSFGALPIADDVRFTLIGAAGTGRVVAFGRTVAPVDVTADAPLDVTIPVRRPYTYVAGADGVVALDGSLEPGQAYESRLGSGAIGAVAATPDGTAVIDAIGDTLHVISTSTHAEIGATLALDAAVARLAIDPTGRWLVAVLPSAVAIVDLPGLIAGTPAAPVIVPTGVPGEVAVSADRAWLVEDPLASLFCSPSSSVRSISLADPEDTQLIPLGGPAGDIAIDPAGRPLIAMPCGAQQIVTLDGTELVPLLSVDGASAVTVANGKIWAMGHVDGEAAHLILASVPLEGGEPELLDLPTLEERAVAPEFDGPGQGASIQATADLASAFDLAVLPDGEHVAILVAAAYLTDEVGDAGFGVPILPEVTMITYEYQLVQLDTGLGAQRLRTSCSIEWAHNAVIDDFRCGLAPGQDEADVTFVPVGLTALYGSR